MTRIARKLAQDFCRQGNMQRSPFRFRHQTALLWNRSIDFPYLCEQTSQRSSCGSESQAFDFELADFDLAVETNLWDDPLGVSMAVRLKDIARDLGVSVVTVSKVLRGNADIGEATRRRVLKRMKELNYQPNMLARGLASGRTFTVGLVVPDLVHPYFAEFAKSLSGVLRTSKRALILASSEEDPEVERQEIRTLLHRGVDVLLIASCQANLPNFYELGYGRTPYLLFDRNFPHLAAHFVGTDDVKVGEMATSHLIEIGRKRIAHIGGKNTSPSFDRLRGYRNALAESKLPAPENYVVVRERVEESGDKVGFQAMQE